MFVLPDRVKETTTTTGSGAISLGGALTGHYKFSDANGVGNGNNSAAIVDDGNGNWEAFFTAVTAGTPDTLSRGTLIKSSTGSRVSFVAGTKTVAVVPLAELMLLVSGSAALAETDIASATTTDLGTVFTFRAHITGTVAITGFGTQPNCLRWVRFASALTLTHNATSLILLGAANRVTATDDVGCYMSDGSGNWRELYYFSAATGFVSNSASAVSMSNSTLTNLTTISLPPGDWDVEGNIDYSGTAAPTAIQGGVSSTSAAFSGIPAGGATRLTAAFASGDNSVIAPKVRFNLTTTTTIYLVGYVAFASGTASADGYIRARRARS